MIEGDQTDVQEPARQDPGLVVLFGQLASDARDVARAEAGLVKARVTAVIDRYKTAVILFAVAGTLAFAALIALLVGLILTLTPYVGAGWATIIVIGAILVIAAVLAMIGKTRLSAVSPR